MRLYDDTRKLDLAPSFEQPLSAGNGRDYLTLLRWIFLFPQALHDYVYFFLYRQRQEKPPPANGQLVEWQQWLLSSPAQIHLLLMALVLASTGLLVMEGLYALLQLGRQDPDLILESVLAGLSIGLAIMVVLSLAALLVGRLAGGLVMAVAHSLAFALWFTLWIAYQHALTPLTTVDGIVYGLLCGLAFGMTYALLFTFLDDIQSISSLAILAMVAIGLLLGFSILAINNAKQGEALLNVGRSDLFVAGSGALAGFCGLLCGLAYPLDWLLIFFDPPVEPDETGQWRVPHVTWWPVSALRTYLETGLARNWSIGLANADQLWRYTQQHTLVKDAIHQILSEASGDTVVEKVATFAKKAAVKTYNWEMILFPVIPPPSASQPKAASSWTTRLFGPTNTTHPVKAQDQRQQRRLEQTLMALGQPPIEQDLPLDTAAKAAVAGFYYLQRYHPHKAVEAFKQVATTSYGRELYEIAQGLAILFDSENLVREPLVKLPSTPDQPRHGETWRAFGELRDVVRYAWFYRQSNDPAHKQWALATVSRKLDAIRNNPQLPKTESALVQALATEFKAQVERWPTISASRSPLKLAANPFVFSAPIVDRRALIGREGEIFQLRNGWTRGKVQPALLYGQPQMGKTSLLVSTANASAKSIYLALINLREIGGEGDIAKSLLSAICQQVANATSYPLPRAHNFDLDPYQTAGNFIRQTCAQLGSMSLVIGLDEYEESDALFPEREVLERLLLFLWQLYESTSNLDFVFISQAPPTEFGRNYANPFANGVVRIHLSYLKERAIRRLLIWPTPDFAPVFTDDAIQLMTQLTAGQPYLLQLIAHFVVAFYNNHLLRVSDDSEQPDPALTVDHVERTRQDSEFKNFSHRYFSSLLRQVRKIDPNSEAVLRCLATRSEGLSEGQLSRLLQADLSLDPATLLEVLAKLADYEVIQLDEANHHWHIRVQLFQAWMAETEQLL